MTVLYFGPERARKEWEVQTPTPVGELCLSCEEPVREGEAGTMTNVWSADEGSSLLAPIHYECSMRSVIGSVGHLRGECSCEKGDAGVEDPPGMTKREAALAAVALWETMQRP